MLLDQNIYLFQVDVAPPRRLGGIFGREEKKRMKGEKKKKKKRVRERERGWVGVCVCVCEGGGGLAFPFFKKFFLFIFLSLWGARD